jgi:hypothetical protein
MPKDTPTRARHPTYTSVDWTWYSSLVPNPWTWRCVNPAERIRTFGSTTVSTTKPDTRHRVRGVHASPRPRIDVYRNEVPVAGAAAFQPRLTILRREPRRTYKNVRFDDSVNYETRYPAQGSSGTRSWEYQSPGYSRTGSPTNPVPGIWFRS